MKKKAKNNIKAKKSAKLNKSNKKSPEAIKAKQEKADKLKKEKKERKENNISDVKQSIKALSKALLSMGGVKKNTLTEKDKELVKQKSEELRKARKEQYENRRLSCLKRRLKLGEKSEEEIKKSLDELKEEMAKQKRYDILMIFNPNNKTGVVTALSKMKITATFTSDDYVWIKNTDVHVLDKLRKIPIDVNIWPYKASEKPSVEKKSKKPTNNTSEAKKAAKSKRNAANIARFESQHTHKMKRDSFKKTCTKSLKEIMKAKFGKVSRRDVETGNFIKKVA